MLNKKNLIILIIIVLVIISIMLFSFKDDTKYTIIINKIDDYSPARILKVYDEKEKEISFKEIRYKDNVFLCNSKNPTVYYGDVENERKLKVIINDNMEVMAKVVKGGKNEKK